MRILYRPHESLIRQYNSNHSLSSLSQFAIPPELTSSGISNELALFIHVKYRYEEDDTGFNWGDAGNFAEPPTLTVLVPKPTDSEIITLSNSCADIEVHTLVGGSWVLDVDTLVSNTPSTTNTAFCEAVIESDHYSKKSISSKRTSSPGSSPGDGGSGGSGEGGGFAGILETPPPIKPEVYVFTNNAGAYGKVSLIADGEVVSEIAQFFDLGQNKVTFDWEVPESDAYSRNELQGKVELYDSSISTASAVIHSHPKTLAMPASELASIGLIEIDGQLIAEPALLYSSNSDDNMQFRITDPQGQCVIGGTDDVQSMRVLRIIVVD